MVTYTDSCPAASGTGGGVRVAGRGLLERAGAEVVHRDDVRTGQLARDARLAGQALGGAPARCTRRAAA
ncbi:hypothetical protein ACU686_05245 [Yinghuangia aomiensis]